ncbi:MAG: hypothetical protein CMJ58_12365 [Planctomycetaceae bacterium]|nr:hypothetical protein [Planctomycetaceae bacterium]
MEWLFERTIELAAWVAFILGVVFLCDAGYLLFQWVQSLGGDAPSRELLGQAGYAAACFVASALALGALACIDRYVFDLPEESVNKS